MKVVILCGGLGTRLREETEFRPKPMVGVGGRPIIWHIMKMYAYYGFKEFVLCLGYKGEMIKEYFYNYGVLNNDFTIELGKRKHIEIHRDYDEKNWKVTLVDTGKNSLKGARLKLIEQYIDSDEFMMTYGDTVANIDIKKLISYHNKHGKLATVTGINPASRFGQLKIENDRVKSFSEKPKEGNTLINGGFFVFKRNIFDYLSPDDDCDLEIGPLEDIAKNNQLMVYKHKGFWACMDTIRDRDYLNSIWHEGKAEWKIW